MAERQWLRENGIDWQVRLVEELIRRGSRRNTSSA
jgi:hypothetical protein